MNESPPTSPAQTGPMQTRPRLALTGAALLALSLLPALAQTDPSQTQPAQNQPTQTQPVQTPSVPQTTPSLPSASLPNWTQGALASASYVMLPARIEGNVSLLTPDQQTIVLETLNRDSRGAIARKYPQAQFVAGGSTTDGSAPGVITVQPVAVMPAGFWPWATLQGRLEFTDAGGNRLIAQSTFNLLTVYQQQAQAANYVFDIIMAKMP